MKKKQNKNNVGQRNVEIEYKNVLFLNKDKSKKCVKYNGRVTSQKK